MLKKKEKADHSGGVTTSHTQNVFQLSKKTERKDAGTPSTVYIPVSWTETWK